MQRRAEGRDLLDARPALQCGRHLVEARAFDDEGRQPGIARSTSSTVPVASILP